MRFALEKDEQVLDTIRRLDKDFDLDRRHLQRRRPARGGRIAERSQSHRQLVLSGPAQGLRRPNLSPSAIIRTANTSPAPAFPRVSTPGLFLTSLIAGEQVAKTLQLGIEYYPDPPFPEKRVQDVAPEIQERIRRFESEVGIKQLAQEAPFKNMFQLSPRGHDGPATRQRRSHRLRCDRIARREVIRQRLELAQHPGRGHHRRHADNADQDLGGDIAFDLNQEPVRGERQENAEAEDRQRVLSDQDQRAQARFDRSAGQSRGI